MNMKNIKLALLATLAFVMNAGLAQTKSSELRIVQVYNTSAGRVALTENQALWGVDCRKGEVGVPALLIPAVNRAGIGNQVIVPKIVFSSDDGARFMRAVNSTGYSLDQASYDLLCGSSLSKTQGVVLTLSGNQAVYSFSYQPSLSERDSKNIVIKNVYDVDGERLAVSSDRYLWALSCASNWNPWGSSSLIAVDNQNFTGDAIPTVRLSTTPSPSYASSTPISFTLDEEANSLCGRDPSKTRNVSITIDSEQSIASKTGPSYTVEGEARQRNY